MGKADPTKKFRFISSEGTSAFSTEQSRDDAAEAAAKRTGDSVMIENWSADLPQGEPNGGWGTIKTVHPREWERPYRNLLPNGATVTYTTQMHRDTHAQRLANRDQGTVSSEVWTPGQGSDELNNGWACDKIVEPERSTP